MPAATASSAASANTSRGSSITRRRVICWLWIASASSSGLASPKWAGTECSKARPWAATVLASRGRRDRGHPDVVATTPVTGDLAERGEANLAAVGRDADAVDSGAADDGDAPAALGAGAEDGKGVVADGGPARPATLADDRMQSVLLGREVDAGHAQDGHLGNRPVRAVEPGLLDRLVDEPLEHVEAPGERQGGAGS